MLGHALLLVVFELVLWPLIRLLNQSNRNTIKHYAV